MQPARWSKSPISRHSRISQDLDSGPADTLLPAPQPAVSRVSARRTQTTAPPCHCMDMQIFGAILCRADSQRRLSCSLIAPNSRSSFPRTSAAFASPIQALRPAPVSPPHADLGLLRVRAGGFSAAEAVRGVAARRSARPRATSLHTVPAPAGSGSESLSKKVRGPAVSVPERVAVAVPVGPSLSDFVGYSNGQ
jgi:hypothetical protein